MESLGYSSLVKGDASPMLERPAKETAGTSAVTGQKQSPIRVEGNETAAGAAGSSERG